MSVGIEELGVGLPKLKILVNDLAKYRGWDQDITSEIGIHSIGIPDVGQDNVTFAVDAVCDILDRCPKKISTIERIAVGSEGGPDDAKSIASFVQGILKKKYSPPFHLSKNMEVMNYTQACAATTIALLDSFRWVKDNPGKTALVIGTDIATYERGTKPEYTQGAGAIAMLVSENPKILEFVGKEGRSSESVADFWKPHSYEHAIVKGDYSVKCYLRALTSAYNHFKSRNDEEGIEFDSLFFHTPTPSVVSTALKLIRKNTELKKVDDDVTGITNVGQNIGNNYNASLYLNMLSAIESGNVQSMNSNIGLYSYGSGYLSYFFAMRLLSKDSFTSLNDSLNSLILISPQEYDKLKYDSVNKSILAPKGCRRVCISNGLPEYDIFI
ncbi:MAG: hydroxymethylglutaryl-CoA synthase family protein [Candidatus Woesearchaeota archaeon]